MSSAIVWSSNKSNKFTDEILSAHGVIDFFTVVKIFTYKIGIITRHKNKFNYKSNIPFLSSLLMGNLVIAVNSSHELIVGHRNLAS